VRGFDGFVGGGDGEVNEASHLLHFFFLDEVEGIEVADLGGDLTGEGGGIEGRDAIDAALAREQRRPDLAGGVAQGADQADAGDDDASLMIRRQIILRIAFPQGLKPNVFLWARCGTAKALPFKAIV